MILYIRSKKDFQVARYSPFIMTFNVKHFRDYAGYSIISDKDFTLEFYKGMGVDTREFINSSDILLTSDTTNNPTDFSFNTDETEVTFTKAFDPDLFRHIENFWYRLYIEYTPENAIACHGAVYIQ